MAVIPPGIGRPSVKRSPDALVPIATQRQSKRFNPALVAGELSRAKFLSAIN